MEAQLRHCPDSRISVPAAAIIERVQPSRAGSLRGWLELVRPPNLFTVPGDILAGAIGNGNIAGPTGVLKSGTGTAVLNLTNNSFTGDVTVNGGSLQFGVTSGMPSTANLVVGTNGTMQMAGVSLTVKELTGSGVVDNNNGLETLLTLGSSSGDIAKIPTQGLQRVSFLFNF